MKGSGGIGRREFLGILGAFAAKVSLGGLGLGCRGADEEIWEDLPPEPPELPEGIFSMGVASGDPLEDSVVIWTRLASDPLEVTGRGGMPDVEVPVIWEVFADPELTELVQTGWLMATQDWAHSVHIDVSGLNPATPYWYRFRVGDQESIVGRTRTLPAAGTTPEKLRLALASCQKYRDGYYTAHDHLAAMELDAIVFLGDYIYESGNQSDVPGRLPIDEERVTDLAGFRTRYGGYRMDPSLQAAHQAHPWIVTWDDHEVSNNYGGFHLSESRRDDGDPVAMRAAGYQAWFEHMPVRIPSFEDPAFMKIYRRFDFGDLARMVVLDTRQYRDPQPCNDEIGVACDEIFEEGRTLLGEEQLQWLTEELRSSEATWNLVAQQVLFSPVLLELGLANPDQWDGYLEDRQAVLDLMGEPGVRSPMMLSGDVHAAAFCELYADQLDKESARVALEVLTTSISSGGDEADSLAQVAGSLETASPRLHFVDAAHRGFAVLELTATGCEVIYYGVTTVRQPAADLYEVTRFTVEEGSLAFQRS